MMAAGTTATTRTRAIDPDATGADSIWAADRLPWVLALPLIGGLSFGLWLGLWEIARLALAD